MDPFRRADLVRVVVEHRRGLGGRRGLGRERVRDVRRFEETQGEPSGKVDRRRALDARASNARTIVRGAALVAPRHLARPEQGDPQGQGNQDLLHDILRRTRLGC